MFSELLGSLWIKDSKQALVFNHCFYWQFIKPKPLGIMLEYMISSAWWDLWVLSKFIMDEIILNSFINQTVTHL